MKGVPRELLERPKQDRFFDVRFQASGLVISRGGTVEDARLAADLAELEVRRRLERNAASE